jgi:hypothetical protein
MFGIVNLPLFDFACRYTETFADCIIQILESSGRVHTLNLGIFLGLHPFLSLVSLLRSLGCRRRRRSGCRCVGIDAGGRRNR